MYKSTFKAIEEFMLKEMKDSAHDYLHIYRVTNQAMEIALEYPEANNEIVLVSSLLHDIGREAQYRNPDICHAKIGGEMAYDFLISIGWGSEDALHVKECIQAHRYRVENPPKTIEAKILFDSDKLDSTGAIGIARTLNYGGIMNEPLYTIDENMIVHEGNCDSPESFLKEYNFKLIKLYDSFYTEKAKNIAEKRKDISMQFYNTLMSEIKIGNIRRFLD